MRYWIDYDKAEQAIRDMREEYIEAHPEKDSFDTTFNAAFDLGAYNAISAIRRLLLSKEDFKITNE